MDAIDTRFVLNNLKIEQLNEMQEASIDAIKHNADVILLSATGSGKTLAFLLPVVQALDADINNVQALIIVPSRELAIQINQQIQGFSYFLNINSVTVYGGRDPRGPAGRCRLLAGCGSR